MSDLPPSDQLERAVTSALRWLKASDRTEAELRERLAARGFDLETIAVALDRLASWGYLNDAKVATEYARRGLQKGNLSRERILAELERRGIGSAEALLAVEAALGEQTEEERAFAALASRFKSSPGGKADAQRGARYLAARGFPEETVLEAVTRFFEAE